MQMKSPIDAEAHSGSNNTTKPSGSRVENQLKNTKNKQNIAASFRLSQSHYFKALTWRSAVCTCVICSFHELQYRSSVLFRHFVHCIDFDRGEEEEVHMVIVPILRATWFQNTCLIALKTVELSKEELLDEAEASGSVFFIYQWGRQFLFCTRILFCIIINEIFRTLACLSF